MFVAPYALPTTVRFVEAVLAVPGARVGMISADPQEAFGERVTAGLAGHWQTTDCTTTAGLTASIGVFVGHFGGVDRVVTILENIVEQVAEACATLGVDHVSPAVARRFRDKAEMKRCFDAAGIPCARSARADSAADGRDAVARCAGPPVVVKPLAGAGARETFRLDSLDQIDQWLAHDPPSPAAPVVVEEFVRGTEHSFDSVVIDGRPVWHSIGRYAPTPLEVVATPWIQWCVVLPRDISGAPFDRFAEVGYRAVETLGLQTGFTHMEWFVRDDGSFAVSEVAVRPPGARFIDLMSVAHDCDMYARWATLAVHHRFEPPQRHWAVGAAYLRAQGSGRGVVAAHGLDRLSEATRSIVVDAQLPGFGDSPRDTYEGDGTVIVRAGDTGSVERALREIISTVRLELGPT